MAEDQAAYEALAAIRKLPPDAPDRTAKFNAALLVCIRVPQAIAATSVSMLELCDRIINFVNYHLLSDLAVCSDLSMASARCALYSVRANLPDVTEASDRQRIESTITQLLSRAAGLIQQVSPRIWARHGQGT